MRSGVGVDFASCLLMESVGVPKYRSQWVFETACIDYSGDDPDHFKDGDPAISTSNLSGSCCQTKLKSDDEQTASFGKRVGRAERRILGHSGTLSPALRSLEREALRPSPEVALKQRDDWHLTDELEYEHGRGDPFAAAVRATRMPMVITDPARADNPIVFCNVAFQDLTGYTRDEIIGRNCRFLQGPETDPATVTQVRDAIAAGRAVDVDLLNYRKDGTTFGKYVLELAETRQ